MKVIKVGASWCAPCTQLDQLIKENSLDIKSVDIDEEFEIAKRYNVRGVPTLLMLDEYENEIKRHVGSITKEQLNEWIER